MAAAAVPLPPSIYLDGCAWGCAFYAGVQAVFEHVWGRDFGQRTLLQGDSSGALVAACWALGLPASFSKDLYADLAECGPVEMLKLRLSDYHDAAMDAIFAEHPDAYLKLRGRLQVGMTVFPREHVWISEWSDQADLRNILHCSMHIPIYCREVPWLRGRPVIDGIISLGGQHLAHGDRTLAISPAVWAGLPDEQTFDLAHQLSASQCLFPPLTDPGIYELFKLGEDATWEWFLRGGMLSNRKRRSRVFKYGGALACAGMWGARFLEQHALPQRLRRPPKRRSRL